VRKHNTATLKAGPQGTTVRRYVREAKLRFGLTGQQVFISSDPQVGQEAEIDWGSCSGYWWTVKIMFLTPKVGF